jgi:GNAT superfamily N-acetyltransferase
LSTVAVGGQPVVLRLLEPAEAEMIRRFYYRLSFETVYRRFMSPVVPPADALLSRLMNIDHCRREALIAQDQDGVAGVARYAPYDDGAAEVAIVVADDWQRRGLGTLLLRRLGHIARTRGIAAFHATLLAENRGAKLFLQHLWPAAVFRFVDGVVEAEIPLRPRA